MTTTISFDNLEIDMPRAQGPDGRDLGGATWKLNGKVVWTTEAHKDSKPITIPTLIIIRVQYQFKVCTSVCVILLTLQDYVKTRGFLLRIRNFATEIFENILFHSFPTCSDPYIQSNLGRTCYAYIA